MPFELNGFVSLEPSVAAFLVPIFRTKGSNTLFVQEANSSFEIIDFTAVDPEAVISIQPATEYAVREIGQSAIIAVRMNGQLRMFGNAAAARNDLRNVKSEDVEPFFGMELFAFLKDRDRLKSSILGAAELLDRKDVAHSWLAVRLATMDCDLLGRVTRRRPAQARMIEELQESIAQLVENPNDPNWIQMWLHLWSRHRGAQQLVDVAGWWLVMEGHLAAEGADKVVVSVTAERRWSRDFGLACIRWLETIPPQNADWTKVLLGALSAQPYQAELVRLAYFTLEEDLGNRSASTSATWIRLWQIIWRTSSDKARAYDLAMSIARTLSVPPRFIRKVIVRIFNDYAGDDALSAEILRNWLLSTPNLGNHWASSAKFYISKRGRDEEVFGHIAERVGLSTASLSRKAQLWRIFLSSPYRAEMLPIGLRWLLEESPRVKGWASLLRDVLEAGEPSETVLKLARDWCHTHAKSDLAKYISKQIERFA